MLISADQVANVCYDFYKKNVPSKNQPVNNEWTTLATIIQVKNNNKIPDLKVICLTTGTKCLAEKALPIDGSLVHDSHAEVLARRCFKRYLFNEIIQLKENYKYESETVENLLINESKNYAIRSEIEFILFISHTP